MKQHEMKWQHKYA